MSNVKYITPNNAFINIDNNGKLGWEPTPPGNRGGMPDINNFSFAVTDGTIVNIVSAEPELYFGIDGYGKIYGKPTGIVSQVLNLRPGCDTMIQSPADPNTLVEGGEFILSAGAGYDGYGSLAPFNNGARAGNLRLLGGPAGTPINGGTQQAGGGVEIDAAPFCSNSLAFGGNLYNYTTSGDIGIGENAAQTINIGGGITPTRSAGATTVISSGTHFIINQYGIGLQITDSTQTYGLTLNSSDNLVLTSQTEYFSLVGGNHGNGLIALAGASYNFQGGFNVSGSGPLTADSPFYQFVGQYWTGSTIGFNAAQLGLITDTSGVSPTEHLSIGFGNNTNGPINTTATEVFKLASDGLFYSSGLRSTATTASHGVIIDLNGNVPTDATPINPPPVTNFGFAVIDSTQLDIDSNGPKRLFGIDGEGRLFGRMTLSASHTFRFRPNADVHFESPNNPNIYLEGGEAYFEAGQGADGHAGGSGNPDGVRGGNVHIFGGKGGTAALGGIDGVGAGVDIDTAPNPQFNALGFGGGPNFINANLAIGGFNATNILVGHRGNGGATTNIFSNTHGVLVAPNVIKIMDADYIYGITLDGAFNLRFRPFSEVITQVGSNFIYDLSAGTYFTTTDQALVDSGHTTSNSSFIQQVGQYWTGSNAHWYAAQTQFVIDSNSPLKGHYSIGFGDTGGADGPINVTTSEVFKFGSDSSITTPGAALTLDGASGINFQNANVTQMDLSATNANTLSFAGGVGLFMASGSGNINFSQATGDFTFPTGTIQYNGASGKNVSITTASNGTLLLRGGSGPAAVQIDDNSNAKITLDETSGTKLFYASTTLTLNASNVVISGGLIQNNGAFGVFGQFSTQQTASGDITYSDSGATVVHTAGTFTGGIGATAYTIGDLVKILKTYGFLAI